MRTYLAALLILLTVFASPLIAETGSHHEEFEFDTAPYRYVIVDGDEDKFRAHHWLTNNYSGGIDEFYASYKLPNDLLVEMEAQAAPRNNEYEALYKITKKNLGYIKFDYEEFRKYYDRTGGTYYRFAEYRSPDSPLMHGEADKDLALDIGKFGVETGINVEGYPSLVLGYEREFRDGAKSRLTWGDVTQGSVTKKISPSFQDIKEIVDIFDVKLEHEVKGFELKNENRWEFVRIDATRQERYFASEANTTASAKALRRQQQKPEADLFSTAFQGAKWLLKDKMYVSSGYRFSQIDQQEFEDIREYDQYGNPRSFSNSENRFNNRAQNQYDSNTWVQNFFYGPVKWLNFGAKLKTEFLNRKSESTYNVELEDPPDNNIGRFDVSDTKMNAQRWGEAFNVRFTAIPKTSLYSELELEQNRVPMTEDRVSVGGEAAASASEEFFRETLTFIQKGAWTLGGRFAPWRFLDFTSHVRHIWRGADYDDIREIASTSSGAKSAFMDGQDSQTDEFLTRVGLKLTKYFQPGFRYIYRDTDYFTRAEAQGTVRSGSNSHNFIFDIMSQIRPDLLATTSFSHQTANVVTPAESDFTVARLPRFNSDVNTWLLAVNYAPRKNFSFNNAFHYSVARNFDDFSSFGLPLGADYEIVDVETGIAWNPCEKLTVEPKYGLYTYIPNPNAEFGEYTAHALTLELKLAWG